MRRASRRALRLRGRAHNLKRFNGPVQQCSASFLTYLRSSRISDNAEHACFIWER